MNPCWLASYPKSGNTWLRFFLYSYFRGQPKSSAKVERFIPDVHAMPKLDDLFKKNALFTKAHFMFSDELASLAPDARSIYIIRNPKDVLLSNLNYFKIRSDQLINEQKFVHNFIENKGVKLWIDHKMGSWVEHVETWTRQKAMLTLVVQYEDLKSSPEKTFSEMLHFIGVEPDDRKVKKAIHFSSFNRMRELEQKEKRKKIFNSVFSGTVESSKKELWFMNSGKSKATLEHIDPVLDRQFDEVFAPYIERFAQLKGVIN